MKLSICIPTFNRIEYLKVALDSVIPQVTDGVEIVISNNDSTDGTFELINVYNARYDFIRVIHQPENIGASKNFIDVVGSAKGEYCWLLGDDDSLKEGSISYILNEIRNGYAVINCNRTLCDIELRPIVDQFWLEPSMPSRSYDFKKNSHIIDYYSRCISVGGPFSYISTLVFKRELWNEINNDRIFVDYDLYPHVYKMLSILSKGKILRYEARQLVNCRSGNDEILKTEGIGKRILMDIENYLNFSEEFYNEIPEVKVNFLRILRKEQSFNSILTLKNNVSADLWDKIQEKLWKCHYIPFEINQSEFLFI